MNKLSEYIYSFTYQKALLHTLVLLAFKIFESLKCILKLAFPLWLLNLVVQSVPLIIKDKKKDLPRKKNL